MPRNDCEPETSRRPADGAIASEPTVSSFVLHALLELLERDGISRSALWARAGLPAEHLQQTEARLPRRELERACALALELTGDPALGLHWAERISHRTFAPASHMLSYVASLRQALALLARFAPLFADEPFFALSEQGDEASVRVLPFAGQKPSVQRFGAELSVGGFLVMMRALHPELRLRRICFAHDAPAHRDEYERVLAHSVYFAQPYTGLVLDAASLDVPLKRADEDALLALSTVAEVRMQRSLKPKSYALRVQDLLVRRTPTRFTIATAAEALGVSERTLRRRLTDEGTSFQEVEYAALAAVARRLLRIEQRTIRETAEAMGFTDSSAFHRAFKRWTGTTPSAYQARATPAHADDAVPAVTRR